MSQEQIKYVLFPGRHHSLTKYQAEWISKTFRRDYNDNPGEPIRLNREEVVWIFPVTSSNHHTTRRNPISLSRRVGQLELFGAYEGIKILVVPIHDIQDNERFAEHIIQAVHTELGITLTPTNTLVAVSTSVGDQYRKLNFRTAGVELDSPNPAELRPYDLILDVANGDGTLFREYAHPVCLAFWDRYDLFTQVKRVFSDAVISSEDGALTETRSYESYAEAFVQSASRKWGQISDWVVPGRIVDVGSATGELFIEAGKDLRFRESDFIGIEPDRYLYTEAVHRASKGDFGNPNTFFYRRNILDGQTFAPASVDSTITLALTHEIFSYGEREKDLLKLVSVIANHTRANGVWVNLDLCASEDADDRVYLKLRSDDGENMDLLHGVDSMAPEDVHRYLALGSTLSRFKQFAYDWPRLSKLEYPVQFENEDTVYLKLSDAMEFMLHKDYTDNWASELREIFTFRNFAFWRNELEKVGFQLGNESQVYKNTWIEENRFKPVATLFNAQHEPREWPTTHMAWVAQKVSYDARVKSYKAIIEASHPYEHDVSCTECGWTGWTIDYDWNDPSGRTPIQSQCDCTGYFPKATSLENEPF